MASVRSDLLAAVARMLVPLAGIVFLGWSAPTMLLLYFADTLLGIAAVCAAMFVVGFPPGTTTSTLAERINAEAGYVLGGLFVAAVLAVPLGLPLVFVLGPAGVGVAALLAQPALASGLVAQAVLAAWSYAGLYRAARSAPPGRLQLKRRLSLALLRWVAFIAVVYSGVGIALGRHAPAFFVAVYAVATFVTEVLPDRVLRGWEGDEAATDPAPPATPAPRRVRRRR